MVKKVLVTGARGQLAGAIVRAAPPGVEVVALDRKALDITQLYPPRDAVSEHLPQVVINCAAYNLVDQAQSDEEAGALAFDVNADAVSWLALACNEYGIKLVHFSTDFVFDGKKSSPYTEVDEPNPLSVYAQSKFRGEQEALYKENLVVRVSRLFGPIENGPTQKPAGNFPLLMLKLGRERDSLRVVSDQIGSPSYTSDLARGVWELLALEATGLYHLSNAGEVDFATYAETVLAMARIECKIERVSTAEYGAPAPRPLYSTLSNAKAQALGVQPLRPWQEALEEFISSQAPLG